MSEWTEDKCLLLIDAYKENSVLWNPKDKDYYKKHLKEDAWTKIGQIMNETGEVCKQKMMVLLASHRRERMKIKKSIGTGKGKDEVYESKWYAFKALRFLDDRFTARKGLESEDSNENAVNHNNNLNTDSDSASPEPGTKKLKPDPKLQMLKEAFGLLKTAADKPKKDAELQCFFDFIQENMKSYTRETKNAIQHEIFQIIMRADQGYYNSIQNYGYYSSSQNQQAPRPSTSSFTITEIDSSAVNIPRASTSSSNQNQQTPVQSAPYSPYSNSSNYSSDMNFEDYV